MFRALLCQSSEGQIVLYNIWYRHTCRLPSGAPVHGATTYRVWCYQMLYNTFWPPDDEHIVLGTCRGYNRTYYKTRTCALSSSVAKIILRCTVSKTSNLVLFCFCDVRNLMALLLFSISLFPSWIWRYLRSSELCISNYNFLSCQYLLTNIIIYTALFMVALLTPLSLCTALSLMSLLLGPCWMPFCRLV